MSVASPFALGLDIGGSNARAAVVERASGRLVASAREAWSSRTPAAVVDTVGRLVDSLGRAHPTPGPVGVGFAGMLRGSLVLNAPNLGWQNVAFGDLLSERLQRPVRLFNDLSAAAWGEFKAGAAQGSTDALTVFVGTGVGSAVIANGALVGGASNVAGEFGHTKVVLEGGRLCGCGQVGCLEAYAGGANLEARMREVGLSGTPADLERLAEQQDARAREVYDFAVDHLGLAIANQVTMLNPAVVVLGGGVLARCPGMVRRVGEFIRARASGPAAAAARVTFAHLGDDSGLVGAALLADPT